MSNTGISLADKTIVLAGAFGQLMQSLAVSLAEHGADVALLTTDVKGPQRFCQNLLDLREVSERYGRAAAFECALSTSEEITEGFSRSAQAFGSIDAYIDTHLISASHKSFKGVLEHIQSIAVTAMPFLKGRTRGRVIYFAHGDDPSLGELQGFIKDLSRDLWSDNITVNAVALGLTEELLQRNYPDQKSIQAALQKHQTEYSRAKLVDHQEASNLSLFLASQLSGAINAQLIRVDHGV